MALARNGARLPSTAGLASRGLVYQRRPAAAWERQLIPRYLSDIDVLDVTPVEPRNQVGGSSLVIDGLVVIDLTADREVVHVEVLAPRHRWIVREPFPEPPKNSSDGSIAVLTSDDDQETLQRPVAAETNRDRSRLRVIFDPEPIATAAVRLSRFVDALVANDQLLGFEFRLSPWPSPDSELRFALADAADPTILQLYRGSAPWAVLRLNQRNGAISLEMAQSSSLTSFDLDALLAHLLQARHYLVRESSLQRQLNELPREGMTSAPRS